MRRSSASADFFPMSARVADTPSGGSAFLPDTTQKHKNRSPCWGSCFSLVPAVVAAKSICTSTNRPAVCRFTDCGTSDTACSHYETCSSHRFSPRDYVLFVGYSAAGGQGVPAARVLGAFLAGLHRRGRPPGRRFLQNSARSRSVPAAKAG